MSKIQGAKIRALATEKTILIALTEIPHISHLAAHLAQLVETTVRPQPDLPVAVLVILPETLLVSPPATIPGGTVNPAVVSQLKGHPISQNHDLSLRKENPPDPEPKEPPEQEDELECDVDLPDHVTRLLTGESELPETPAPKRQKSDSETPPPEDPTIRVSAEVHAEAEMSDASAEPPQADDVILKETVEIPTSSADQPSEDQAQEPSQGAKETVTPVPRVKPRS